MQADLAVLTATQAAMKQDIAEIKADLKTIMEQNGQRLAALETGQALCAQRWSALAEAKGKEAKAHAEKHAAEWREHAQEHRTDNRIVTIISSIVGALAGIVARFWPTS